MVRSYAQRRITTHFYLDTKKPPDAHQEAFLLAIVLDRELADQADTLPLHFYSRRKDWLHL